MEVLSYISLFTVWFNMVQLEFKIDHAEEIVENKDFYYIEKILRNCNLKTALS